MNTEKVSVIIPVYNEGKSVGDLVSQIKTRYPDFDIIVIDDGSTDNTGNWLSLSKTSVLNTHIRKTNDNQFSANCIREE